LFEQVDNRSRLFRRTPNTGRGAIAGQDHELEARAREPEGGGVALYTAKQTRCREKRTALLARYAPACVLINQAFTILQFRGQTAPISNPPAARQALTCASPSPGAACPRPSCDQ
jgi:hypothetical protein